MDLEDLAKRIRHTCIEAVVQAYEDAGVQGLCAEGRWEAAVSALRTVELAPLLREFKQTSADSSPNLQSLENNSNDVERGSTPGSIG